MLKGELQEISLVDLIQVTCNDKTQSRLAVLGEEGEASLYFDGGEIVHAELGELSGKDALFKVLRWSQGSFELAKRVPPPTRTLTAGSMELLLAAMASIDADAGTELGDDAIRKEMEAFEENLRRELETSGVDLYEDRADQNVARRLRRVPGIAGAVLVARDGTVLADDLEGDAAAEAAVAALVGNAASEIGDALALGPLERGSVAIGGDRMLVLEQPKYFVGLLLEERASPELVHAEARKLLS